MLNYCNSQPILEDLFLKDHNYNECIKTSILSNNQNYLLDPIIKLNSEETLKLSFDDLNNNLESYSYTFIHCNSHWEKSEIIYSEYFSSTRFEPYRNKNIIYVSYTICFRYPWSYISNNQLFINPMKVNIDNLSYKILYLKVSVVVNKNK